MELTSQEISRFKRHLLLPEIGVEGQLALKKARVLVIGAGGLGNAVLPYLAAAGVGNITVIDNDVVDISNLQRQVLFTENDLGKPKSELAVKRLQAINSNGNFTSHQTFFTESNALELAKNQDVIVDCVDQIHVRYLINDAAVYYEIPMVYGAIHKFEGQVAVFNHKESATYRCAFPENKTKKPAPNCEELGVVGVLPGIIGMYQAMEVIKIITGAGTVLSNKIWMIDLLNNANHTIAIERNKESIEISKQRMTELASSPQNNEIIDITGADIERVIAQHANLVIIDIQPQTNVESLAGVAVTHIPVFDLESRLIELDKSQPILLYCAHGINSQWATQLLKQEEFKTIYHLVGGITAV
tara:strand:+ start:20798 stop:21871 length:1074 start_codon:yes stop_codon:yes gene_type:complete